MFLSFSNAIFSFSSAKVVILREKVALLIKFFIFF